MMLVRALIARAAGFRNNRRIQDAAALCRELSRQCREVYRRFGRSNNPAVRLEVAEALVNIGVFLESHGERAAAIGIYDRVIEEFEGADVPLITALYSKAGILMDQGQEDEALGVYRLLIERSCNSASLENAIIRGCSAEALRNLGVIFAHQGLMEEALAACDLAGALGDDPDAVIQGIATQALYNKAMMLSAAKRYQEAIAAFTSVVERFANAPSDTARRWAGVSQYGKAMRLAQLGDTQASIAATEELVRLFGDSRDPTVRERVAKALYHRALLAWLEESEDMATEIVHACTEIQARFGEDDNPVVQAVVAAARRYDRFIGALDNPSFDAIANIAHLDPVLRAHVARSGDKTAGLINLVWYRDAELMDIPAPTLAEIIEAAQRGWLPFPVRENATPGELELTTSMMEEQFCRDMEGHLRCGEILARYLDTGEPFGLFLRNFDVEGSLQNGSFLPGKSLVSVQLTHEGHVEKKLVETLSRKLPLVGVGNNVPIRPDFQHHLPRLLLRNDHWQEVVEELIRAATMIVVNIARLTPGVLAELAMIERLGRQEQTVVILSPSGLDEVAIAIAEAMRGMELENHPKAQRDSAALTGFHRIISEAELSDSVVDVPCFADLVAMAEEVRAVSPDKRARWDGIIF